MKLLVVILASSAAVIAQYQDPIIVRPPSQPSPSPN